MSDGRSGVTDATRRAEAEEAHYREMTDIGAHEVGEGRVP